MDMPQVKIPFDPDEMTVVFERPAFAPGIPPIPVFKTPIQPVDNIKLFLANESPLWMPCYTEIQFFNPHIIPDNIARAMVIEEGFYPIESNINKDYFGVEWEFVPQVRGSMTRPGKPFLNDISEWKEKVVFPDLSTWDWSGSRIQNETFLNDPRAIQMTVFTGFFERLVSMLDMEPALVAMIDEESESAVCGFFDRLCEFYDELFYYMAKWFQPDLMWFHDDWGSQRAPLFSLETCRKMLVPYLKRTVESAHKYGIGFELHSCGKNDLLVPAMIEAGVDMWFGQPMNDKETLYREYGKDIKLGLDLPMVTPDMPDEVVKKNVCELLDKFPENCYVGMSMGIDGRYFAAIYEESRKRYN